MEPDTDKRRSSLGARVTVTLILLLLYPLSAGPVGWLGEHGYVPQFFEYAYTPLMWLYMASPAPVQEAFVAYLTWWHDLP